jgi:hypothetical protein
MNIEVVVTPVSAVARAKEFYGSLGSTPTSPPVTTST